jgi:uncharacterized membrane protein YuzA (DUF378 family)
MKTLDVIAAVVLVIGGLNWGLVGAFDWDIVAALVGELGRAIYVLVGLAALYQALSWREIQKRWALAWARYE